MKIYSFDSSNIGIVDHVNRYTGLLKRSFLWTQFSTLHKDRANTAPNNSPFATNDKLFPKTSPLPGILYCAFTYKIPTVILLFKLMVKRRRKKSTSKHYSHDHFLLWTFLVFFLFFFLSSFKHTHTQAFDVWKVFFFRRFLPRVDFYK